MPRKTALDLLKMKADSQKIVMVTAYDYTMARLVDAAGVDMVDEMLTLAMLPEHRHHLA